MQVKDRVLAALEASRGTYLSGQALAQQLQVSRNAVWKGHLPAAGERVSHPSGLPPGVLFGCGQSPPLPPEHRPAPHRAGAAGGGGADGVLHQHPPCASGRRKGPQEGLVLAAVEQTAGKGRQGHSSLSPHRTRGCI